MTAVSIEQLSDGLSLSDDGIWRATAGSSVSYPSTGHSACLAVEEGSFWFNHRNECIRTLIAAFPPVEGKPLLDVGGGNGYVSVGLEQAGVDVILVEPGESGAKNAKQRGLEHVICATTTTAAIHPNAVGAIGLFDVIEHIDDDHEFMAQMHSLLAEGAPIYATVPAYQRLWSADDETAGHQRRHSVDSIVSLFEAAGFDVDYASHFFRPLPAPVLLFRTLPYRFRRWRRRGETVSAAAAAGGSPDTEPSELSSAARSHASDGKSLANAIRWLLRPEVSNIKKQKPMRFGGSIIIAAHRR